MFIQLSFTNRVFFFFFILSRYLMILCFIIYPVAEWSTTRNFSDSQKQILFDHFDCQAELREACSCISAAVLAFKAPMIVFEANLKF